VVRGKTSNLWGPKRGPLFESGQSDRVQAKTQGNTKARFGREKRSIVVGFGKKTFERGKRDLCQGEAFHLKGIEEGT